MTVSGGPIFWILMALAVSAVVVFFERWFELRRAQIDWPDFIKGVVNVLESGNENEALAICDDTSAPVANVVATAIRHRKGSSRILREAVDAQGRAEVGRLERRLATLGIIGQIAPMLGLLGAIVGFIKVMLLVNSAEIIARADLGVGVAIPVAVMYGSLRIRMDRFVGELEAAATDIVGYVSTNRGEVAK